MSMAMHEPVERASAECGLVPDVYVFQATYRQSMDESSYGLNFDGGKKN